MEVLGPVPLIDLLARECKTVHPLPQSQQELWGFPISRLGLVTVAGWPEPSSQKVSQSKGTSSLTLSCPWPFQDKVETGPPECHAKHQPGPEECIWATARVSSRLNSDKKCLKTLSLLGWVLRAICDSDVTLPLLKTFEQLWTEVGQVPH